MTEWWVEETGGRDDLPLWTRSHASDLFPGPVMPLDFDLLVKQVAAPAWHGEFTTRLGFEASELPPEAETLLGVFGGHVYLNASLLRTWATRMPALHPDQIVQAYVSAELPVDEGEPPQDEWEGSAVHRWLRWALLAGDQSALTAQMAAAVATRAERPDFTQLLDDAVFQRVRRLQAVLRPLSVQYLHQMLAAAASADVLATVCAEMGSPIASARLLTGMGGVETTASANALWTLSRLVSHSAPATAGFISGLDGIEERLRLSPWPDVTGLLGGVDALVAEIDSVGATSWELALAGSRSAAEETLAAIDWLRRSPDDADPGRAMARAAAKRALAVAEVAEVVASRNGEPGRQQFLATVRSSESFVRGRQTAHRAMELVREELRRALLELGNRAVARNDIEQPDDLRLLFANEVAYYADGGLATIGELVDHRRERARSVAADPPAVIDVRHRGPACGVAYASPLPVGGSLTGRPVAADVGRGPVRIIDDESTPIDPVQPGSVLVLRAASTAWLPRLIGAAGVVVESGGLLGHLSILCRELGVPLVTGATGATRRLREFAVVEVDGPSGSVTVVNEPPADAGGPVPVTLDPWGVRS
ncbi:MAG: PEP-utilizing enzyme [Actinomycetota bacterium]